MGKSSSRKVNGCQDKRIYLIHFEERSFTHFLQGTYFASLLLACQINLTISTLADLSYDVELLHTQLRSPSPEEHPLTSTVRFKLFMIVCWYKVARGGIFVELCTTFFSVIDVT